MVNEHDSTPANPKAELDFVILADRADVLNGKLYMMGGCWGKVTIPVPAALPMSLAMRVFIPRGCPERTFRVDVALEGGAEGTGLVPGSLRFELAHEARTTDAQVVVGLPVVLTLPSAGPYTLRAVLDGANEKSLSVLVEQAPTA
jgi:hypothetical protein